MLSSVNLGLPITRQLQKNRFTYILPMSYQGETSFLWLFFVTGIENHKSLRENSMKNEKEKHIQDIDPMSMMRPKQVIELATFGHASLWRFTKNGQFPVPARVIVGVTACRNADTIAWLEAQSAANKEA